MKTLVFSDTHLSSVDDPHQRALLKKVISSADRVIINGDFWDQYLCSFDEFVHSAWKELFPLLKKRKTIYILGNHDTRQFIDDRWKLFADKVADELDLRIGTQRFHIEHGHQHSYTFGLYYPRLSAWFGRFYPYLDRIEQGGHVFTNAYRAYMRHQHDDKELLSYAKAHKQKNLWHIFAHSHLQRMSKEDGYINTGSFRCRIGNWLMIDEVGVVTLHNSTY